MIKQGINKVVLIVTGVLVMMTVVHAKQPWIYSAPNPTSVSVSEGGSATVTYPVTSQANKPKSLVLQTNPPAPYPSTPGITASACNLPKKGSTCTLTITIDGSQVPATGIHGGPYLCQADSNSAPNSNQCYQPRAANLLSITKNTTQATSLSVSVSNLALSVTGYTEYGVTGTPTSGVARLITVTNTGSSTATNLSLAYPAWPSSTIATDTCTSTLAAGGTCTITIQPGNTATSGGASPCTTSRAAPIPQAISVSADNASTVSSNVVILGYGCIYQSGYVYAFDDTTATTGSVGGKVVTTSDQTNGIVWSSNGNGGSSTYFTYDIIPLIGDSVTGVSPTYDAAQARYNTTYSNPLGFQFPDQSSFASCSGALDGACNSSNILALYSIYITNSQVNTVASGPTPTNFYAAGFCSGPIGSPSHSDWYLPAICEMGYYNPGVGSNNAGCGSSATPTLQNIQTSLIDLSNFTSPAGVYWSSTEDSGLPQTGAWGQYFASGGVSGQFYFAKSVQLDVRCSRALTI